MLCALCGFSVAAALESVPAVAAEAASESDSETVESTTGLRDWDAPEGCIDLSALRAKVAVQNAQDSLEFRSVEGHVLMNDAGWAVTLTVYEGEVKLGQRFLELKGDDCRAHDETLALVVALLLEHGPPPPEESEQTQSETEPEPSVPPQETSDDVADVVLEPPRKRPSGKIRGRVGIGVRALGGLSPSLSWGPTVLGGVIFLEHWAVDLQGDFYTKDTEPLLLSEYAAAAGEMVTTGARVHARACVMSGEGRVRVSACPGFGWIMLQASGRSMTDPQSATYRSAEAGAEIGILGRIFDPVSLLLEGGLLVPLRQGSFVLTSPDGVVEVHETAAAFATGGLFLLVTL